MKILVTGASGFIGTHLCAALDDEHQVILTDRMDADLSRPYEVGDLIRDLQPEYVIHLGARYGRILCRDEPHKAVCDNAAGTTELAAACADLGIPVLYASSSEVYGDHGEDTITETSELRTPTTIYGLSKRWGEEALRLYLPPEQLCIVRLNMAYGEEQRGGYGMCSLATFVKSAVEGEPFVVHEGTTRSWLHVSDAVRALRLLVNGGHTGIFNLGNPSDKMAMVQVGGLVCAEVPGARFSVAEPPVGQIRHKNYDCSKVLRTIDWKPEVSLREGIAKTVEWAQRAYAPVS